MFVELGGNANRKLQIADSYWYLHTQPRSHFTQELGELTLSPNRRGI
jgi:hypothetical protein